MCCRSENAGIQAKYCRHICIVV